MERQAQRGFTLLEVLVVVALIALTSAILVPALLRVDTGAKVEAAAKLADTLTELSERSLFLGQITALRLDDHGYTPLYYDISSETFQPFDEDNLASSHFSDGLTLSWQPDDASLSGQLQGGMSKQRKDDDKDEKSDSSQDTDTLPQIFFLPGGQASSGLLAVTDADGHVSRLELNPLGQVTQLDSGDKSTDDKPALPPLLLPDDASFYQTQGGAP
jgi:general secretion pathway protein H